MKKAVFLLGAGATGKTTARLALCSGTPQQNRVQVMLETPKGPVKKPFFYTLYDNAALAGNIGTGTDGNTAPRLIRMSFFKCLELNDLVVIDGVMGSPRLIEMVNDYEEEIKVLCVHFDISPTETLRRLSERRARNGIVETELPKKTLDNSNDFIRRAKHTVAHFQTKCTKPVFYETIQDNHTPEQIAEIINNALNLM